MASGLLRRWRYQTSEGHCHDCDRTELTCRFLMMQFHCSTQSVDRIVLIRETAICVYSLVIHTVRHLSTAFARPVCTIVLC